MRSATDNSQELHDLAGAIAADVRRFLLTLREVALSGNAEEGVPVMVLALGSLANQGARLSAMEDVVPRHKFEPDPGEDLDMDAMRVKLSECFIGIDDYVHVVDPLFNPRVIGARLSDDLTEIASSLGHGLSHFDNGEETEALWWWQFSYFSSWGDLALNSLRGLQSILAHLRLDTDEETAADAAFNALHP